MRLEHRAFLYDGIEHFLSVSVPYLTEGVEAGEVVIAVLQDPRLDALRDVMAPHGETIQYVRTEEFYRHPVHALKAYHELVHAYAPRRVWVLGEAAWNWTPRQNLEWLRYESLVNVVFRDTPARALCAYDNQGLPPEILDHARQAHPLLAGEGTTVRNDGYVEPLAFAKRCDRTVRFDRPPGAEYYPVDSDDLQDLRQFVAERAAAHGLAGESVQHLVTAADEVTCNALRHGCPPIGAWVWADGPELLCEIGDHGLWHSDPLVGFIPPHSAMERGFGLWTVRLLVDLMELRTGWDGTFVRLHMRR
jgi:hypothetical protein